MTIGPDLRLDIKMMSDAAERQRHTILEAMLEEAAFEGWNETALENACGAAGIDAAARADGALKRLFPKGIADVLDFWAEREDLAMMAAYEALQEPPARIRDKVTWLVRRRIEQLTPHREAARRAGAVLTLPHLAGLGARLAWRTAGAIWRALGDSSTDGNWYTKRATLSAVYLSTLTRWFADDEEDGETPYSASWAFLDDRICNVMSFEKWKAKAAKKGFDPAGIANMFGRIRYGAGN